MSPASTIEGPLRRLGKAAREAIADAPEPRKDMILGEIERLAELCEAFVAGEPAEAQGFSATAGESKRKAEATGRTIKTAEMTETRVTGDPERDAELREKRRAAREAEKRAIEEAEAKAKAEKKEPAKGGKK